MLLARGNTWNETERQINESGYTGTTWEVYFRYDLHEVDFPIHFFTDLSEARDFAKSIPADTMHRLFGGNPDGVVVCVEEDEWENGEFIEIGVCTWYGYEWRDGEWKVYC